MTGVEAKGSATHRRAEQVVAGKRCEPFHQRCRCRRRLGFGNRTGGTAGCRLGFGNRAGRRFNARWLGSRGTQFVQWHQAIDDWNELLLGLGLRSGGRLGGCSRLRCCRGRSCLGCGLRFMKGSQAKFLLRPGQFPLVIWRVLSLVSPAVSPIGSRPSTPLWEALFLEAGNAAPARRSP